MGAIAPSLRSPWLIQIVFCCVLLDFVFESDLHLFHMCWCHREVLFIVFNGCVNM